MTPPPTGPGVVGPGVRVTTTVHEWEYVPPADSVPARVTARVYVNGLVAGKATCLFGHYYGLPRTEEEATYNAIGVAWMLADRRIEKWRRGIAKWEALP